MSTAIAILAVVAIVLLVVIDTRAFLRAHGGKS